MVEVGRRRGGMVSRDLIFAPASAGGSRNSFFLVLHVVEGTKRVKVQCETAADNLEFSRTWAPNNCLALSSGSM